MLYSGFNLTFIKIIYREYVLVLIKVLINCSFQHCSGTDSLLLQTQRYGPIKSCS